MKICVLMFTDGRNDYLERMLESFSENVIFPEDAELKIILHDDMPEKRDTKHLKKLAEKYNISDLMLAQKNGGINESVMRAWRKVPKDTDFIWHQENDFIFKKKVYIDTFIRVLKNPKIYQVACLRQAWYDNEIEKGGIFQCKPAAYRDANAAGVDIVLHKEFFTHNPSLYRRGIIEDLGTGYGEYAFKNHLLKKGTNGWFAFIGKTTDENIVEHIGERKVKR